jgi:DeoR/GlpR family transcriptional regulator of sugar metabolism
MAREKIITGPNVVNAIKSEEKPFATVTDIAEYLDVSEQGVRNNYDELKNYDGLVWGEIGQAIVFWLPHNEKDFKDNGPVVNGIKRIFNND